MHGSTRWRGDTSKDLVSWIGCGSRVVKQAGEGQWKV